MQQAKATGSGQMLWPEGTNAESVPAPFIVALDQATKILGWFENLGPDEIPPRWMWELDYELEAHFERVKEEREAKYNISSEGPSSDPDREEVQNEHPAAARFRR